MVRHSPSAPSTSSSSMTIRRRGGRSTKSDAANLDSFVSDVYLPHVQLRKRSWKVDARIARQHLSPAFGDRTLPDISRSEVEDWLQDLSNQGLAPATCNRILAVFKSICSLAVLHGIVPAGLHLE